MIDFLAGLLSWGELRSDPKSINQRQIQMTLAFYRDRDFLREMLLIAVPIAFQQLINASLEYDRCDHGGSWAKPPFAALGLSNQVFFVFHPAGLWHHQRHGDLYGSILGKRDVEPIRRVLGMSILTTSLLALFSPLLQPSFLEPCWDSIPGIFR